MKIVLASNNQGKLNELQAMLTPLGCTLLPQGALGVPESPEPFRTFVENALAKARNAAQHTGLPALADDAGLCVDAFGGLPGVDTAYYATQFGYAKSDDNNVKALLEQMRNIDNRRAAMVSTLVGFSGANSWANRTPISRVSRGSSWWLTSPSTFRKPPGRITPCSRIACTRESMAASVAGWGWAMSCELWATSKKLSPHSP